ncbi:MAG TPA: hypothetical protein VIK91_14485 [Nannocystis sp.]
MSTTLILILVVAGAYLAAHVAFGWLARRFDVISGAEYVLLGVLLGPEVSGLISSSVVGSFAPVLTLALGWIGAVVGAQFYLPVLSRIPIIDFRVAFLEATLALALVSAAMTGVFMWLFGLTLAQAVFPSIAMGAVATVSAPSGIALTLRRLGRRAPVARQLEVATAIDALVAIVAFGLLLAIGHAEPETAVRAPTPTEWAVIGIAIGLVGGALFHLFLGGEQEVDRLFIGLAGAIILASGAAAYLRLSPLFPAMLIGFILMNTSANRDAIKEVLGKVERPLYFVLLIFAGAAWEWGGWFWAVPVVIFLVARVLAKVVGGGVAAMLTQSTSRLGLGWGRALFGQGALAIAIGLNYQIVGDLPFSGIVFTAAIVSVLLTDFGSARWVNSVLGPWLRRRPRIGRPEPAQPASEGEA